MLLCPSGLSGPSSCKNNCLTALRCVSAQQLEEKRMVTKCFLSYASFSVNLMLLSIRLCFKRANREAVWPCPILSFWAGGRKAGEHVCHVRLVPLA